MPSYVARTNGLGATEDEPNGLDLGADITRDHIGDDEEWDYHIAHGNIVRAGGPHDPNVLEAQLEDDIPEDPKDRRIAELEASLELFTGRQGTPAAGTHLSDLSDAQDAEDADTESKKSAKSTKSSETAPSGTSATEVK
jgi:hypothetical protein